MPIKMQAGPALAMALCRSYIPFSDMPHRLDHQFVAQIPRLRPHIPYCTQGRWDHGLMGRNRLALNRLFLPLAIDGAPSWCRQHVGKNRGERTQLQTGMAILIPPMVDLEWCFRRETDLFAIHFAWETAPGVDRLSGLASPVQHQVPEKLLRALIDSRRSTTSEPQGLRLLALVELILAEVLVGLEGSYDQQGPLGLRDELHRLSGLPVRADTRVQHMAQLLNIGTDALNKRFQRQLGISPKRWLNQRLLSALGEALLTSQEPIQQLADTYGFSSPFACSRWFHQQSGVSPQAWRQQFTEPAASSR